MADATGTASNGLPYIGNPDYRGYLNYLGQNGNQDAAALLGEVGNDAQWGGSGVPYTRDTINHLHDVNGQLWQQWQNSSGTSAPGNPNGAAAPVLNQGAVDNTQATIDQLPAILQAALAAETTSHQNSLNTFDQQEQQQRGQYNTGTTTNQENYDSNFMDSIRAGIKGLGGLMALLRGTGAAGGSVDQQVRDTVGGVTAQDIRGGADTQKENQGQLDSSLATFLTDLKGKRQANEDTFANNQSAIRRDNATQLQDLYSKMAGYYGDANMTDQANNFMSQAGSLTPEIAANTKTQVSPYDTTPVVVHAPNLTAFASPTQPNVLAGPSDGQVGSGIFTMSDPRRRKDVTTPVAAAPAGA